MRKLEIVDLTKHYRDVVLELKEDTYVKVRNSNNKLQYNLFTMYIGFDGIVMHDLTKLLLWANLNIFCKIDILSYNSSAVLLRIATGMLNKIEYLSKEQKNVLHQSLVDSLHRLTNEWHAFKFINSHVPTKDNELPF